MGALHQLGSQDAFWETGLAPWDLAAGSLIIREAGGIAIPAAIVMAPQTSSLRSGPIDISSVGDETS